MSHGQPTSYSMLERAAAGDADARARFARIYGPVLKSYFRARWRGTRRELEVTDAVQDVFLDCFRQGGVLERAWSEPGARFRPYLYGVARIVALRMEEGGAREELAIEPRDPRLDRGGREDSPSRAFDRGWARAILRLALERLEERAAERGPHAEERARLLEERFQAGRSIREIARLWGVDADRLHRQYARARQEFHESLREALAEECGARHVADADLRELLAALAGGE